MEIKIVRIPKIEDPRGNLSVIEHEVVPFDIKRVYYLYDVPAGAERGGHAHKKLQQFLVALAGSFDVVLNDGKEVGFVGTVARHYELGTIALAVIKRMTPADAVLTADGIPATQEILVPLD